MKDIPTKDPALRGSVRELRLGLLLTHPIQYVSPWLQRISDQFDLKVYYVHRQSADEQGRAGFARPVAWDVPLLSGYCHEWLRNAASTPQVGRFFGCDIPDIESVLVRDELDALLVYGWQHKSTWQALRACRRRGTPILVRGDSNLEQPRPAWKRALKRLLYPPLLRLFDAHLYVGSANRRYLEHYGVPEARLHHVPHAVDSEAFAQAAEAARQSGRSKAIRDELGIARDAFVYLFVGKLISRKRVTDLLSAVAILLRGACRPAVHAVVVGDGPLRRNLESQCGAADEQVHFVGFRNQTELPAWYAMADALVVPGYESWGLVVNEAAACGLPAVVSDRVGCRIDMIEPGASGYVYRDGDPADLARRMLDIRDLVRHKPNAVRQTLSLKCIEYGFDAATLGLHEALVTLLPASDTAPAGNVARSDPRPRRALGGAAARERRTW